MMSSSLNQYPLLHNENDNPLRNKYKSSSQTSLRGPNHFSFTYNPSSSSFSTPTSPTASLPSSPVKKTTHLRHRSTTSTTASSADHHKNNVSHLIREIIECHSYYRVLGVSPSASFDDIRRAYLLRSRIIHPDKHPDDPKATEAFQRITSAYTTLKHANTRAAYDLNGEKSSFSSGSGGEDTLRSVLLQIWSEFIDGNFDKLMILVDIMRNGNDPITQESVESMFQSLRNVMQTCTHCVKSAKPEFYMAMDIHTQLSSLPYLDISGRLNLSMQLLTVLLHIPLTVNKATNGSILPNWSVSILNGLLTVLDLVKWGVGQVVRSPALVRSFMRSLFVKPRDFVAHKWHSVTSWRPWERASPATCGTAASSSYAYHPTPLNHDRLSVLASI